MGRTWRRHPLPSATVAVAAAAGVLVPGTAAPAESAVPANLVGEWSRTVSLANWKHYGAPVYHVGVWTIAIRRSGTVYVYTGLGYPRCRSCVPDLTTRFSVSGARLTVAAVPVCATKGVYGWKASGRALTLTLIADRGCPPREALFTGVWKRA